ncbi:MAG TPA: hypothetical protein VGC30_07680 [Dokdonella sp.]
MSNRLTQLVALAAALCATGAAIVALAGGGGAPSAAAPAAAGAPATPAIELPTIVVRPAADVTVLATIVVRPDPPAPAATLAHGSGAASTDVVVHADFVPTHTATLIPAAGAGYDMPYYSFGRMPRRLNEE